ncbi:MAG TPA: lytic transglycosylase domain-containing protein [Solirubrobacterales bacterium]|nr:lytic transglycosylase domain-containing protein [Solirubrobacterales bacterium]
MSWTTRRLMVARAAGAIVAIALIGCGGASAASPQRVADQLVQNDAELRSAIDSWRAIGDPPSSAPPADVVDRAAELQNLIARLGDHPDLAARVMPLLSGSLRGEVNRLYAARRALLRLSAGSRHKKLKLGQRPPLADLVSFYDDAERRFGIGANYLAAIHLVETKFGRVVNNSVAGAQGPMQFIPSTWRIYGKGGDIRDPHDAILAAARLLRANGAPRRYGPALRAYNPSGLYVDAVSRYAREIARNPYALYFLYCWEP